MGPTVEGGEEDTAGCDVGEEGEWSGCRKSGACGIWCCAGQRKDGGSGGEGNGIARLPHDGEKDQTGPATAGISAFPLSDNILVHMTDDDRCDQDI